MDLHLIEQLIRMVNMSSLSCLEVEEQGVRIRLENQIMSAGASVGTGAVHGNVASQFGATTPLGPLSGTGQPVMGVSDPGLGLGSAPFLQNGEASVGVMRPQEPLGQGSPAAVPVQEEDVICIKSPLVGTYYSTQALGYDPVETGDKVTAGQAVCAVEAMKLMNVIEADVAGEILEFLVEDGAMVEYGQDLVKMRKS